MNSGSGTEKVVRAISTFVLLVLIAPAIVRAQTTDTKKKTPGTAPAPARSTAPAQTKQQPAPVRPGGPIPQTKTSAGKSGRGPSSTDAGKGGRSPGSPDLGRAGREPGSKGGLNGPGPLTHAKQSGEEARSLPGGRTEFRSSNGRTVTTDAHGEVRRIETPPGLTGKTVINRGPGGGRIVETGRPGARVVSYGPHRGFVERTVRPGYISRTYVVGGRSYVRVYHEYRYRGVVYYHYVPAVYYGPAFYGWVARPWAPVPYFWGNGITTPWFGFYAGYFVPAPVYASPDQWLTDYLLAENLRLAYDNQQGGNGGQAPPPPAQSDQPTAATVDQLKPLIAEEVRQQLAAERAAAAQPTSNPQQPAPGTEQLPPAFNQKFFVVSSNLDVVVAAQTCVLTPGDILQRTGKEPMPDGSVAVEVESSKPGECPRDSATAVQLADLQEMHNQFREQIDSGLKMLAENQAKGLPNGPAAAPRPVAEGTADQTEDALAQLRAQQDTADNLEAQVRQGGN